MIHLVNNTQLIQLTTITPVSIGDGGTLSPLTDYIVDGDKVYYINHKKFQDALAKDNELMNKFIKGVKESVNVDKTTFLKSFIVEKLRVDHWKSLMSNPDSQIENKLYSNPTEFKTILKDGIIPYISGSTLKGAIRTALLYNWHIKNNKSYIANEEDLFGDVQQGHKSRFINLSDTFIDRNIKAEDAIVILGTDRIRIKVASQENASTPPSPREAIKENTELQFRIKVEGDFDFKNIMTQTKEFYRACAKFELEELHKAQHPIFETEIKNLRLFYEKTLLNQVQDDEILMRIGLGKTQYDNSLMLAIYNNDDSTDKSNFRRKRKEYWGVPENQNIYPASRTITKKDHLPLGWVKIKLLK